MKKFTKNFEKTVWGFITVEANSREEAEEKFNNGDYDEFDNKSDYELGEWEEEEERRLNDETMEELTGETDKEYNKRMTKR